MNVYHLNDALNNACIEKMLSCDVSVSQICKTAYKLRYCTKKDKMSLLNGEISPKGLRERAGHSPAVKSGSDLHLTDTAKLFDYSVNSLEDTVETLLSGKYLSTFEEKDSKSKEIILDCCERLEKISTVISSLLA